MARISVKILSDREIQSIHDAALSILRDTGIMVHHDGVLELLAQAGARVDKDGRIARLPEKLVMDSIEQAGKKYVLYGRNPQRTARFGYGDLVLMSSPGQYSWIDTDSGERRAATIQDAREAIKLGDALSNITIVGSMAQPEQVSQAWRDVYLTGELVKGTGKPTRCWVKNGRTARYILQIYRTVAGGPEAEFSSRQAFLHQPIPLAVKDQTFD